HRGKVELPQQMVLQRGAHAVAGFEVAIVVIAVAATAGAGVVVRVHVIPGTVDRELFWNVIVVPAFLGIEVGGFLVVALAAGIVGYALLGGVLAGWGRVLLPVAGIAGVAVFSGVEFLVD